MGWNWVLYMQVKEACAPTCLSELSRGAPGNSNQRNCPGPHVLFFFFFHFPCMCTHTCMHACLLHAHVCGACIYMHMHVEARGCQESSPITLLPYSVRQGSSQTRSSQIWLVFIVSQLPRRMESQEDCRAHLAFIHMYFCWRRWNHCRKKGPV